MEYITAAQAAKRWGISARSVRNYCAQGRVEGAFLSGKTWNIPADAEKPARKNARSKGSGAQENESPLLARLREEKDSRMPGGIYHRVQVELTYNSNHIEGSRLTHEQTRLIFETATVGVDAGPVRVDDIIETSNHFRCVDLVIERAFEPLTEAFIKELHGILKESTADSAKDWFAVGDYKRLPNEVGGRATVEPEQVADALAQLIRGYESNGSRGFADIVAFHVSFERIHPFQDGNGRVGRLIAFKECLRNGITPFVIDEEKKLFYYRGLSEWDRGRGCLMDTCLAGQDTFKEWLEFFRIPYAD